VCWDELLPGTDGEVRACYIQVYRVEMELTGVSSPRRPWLVDDPPPERRPTAPGLFQS
jgi:hypothetical protein